MKRKEETEEKQIPAKDRRCRSALRFTGNPIPSEMDRTVEFNDAERLKISKLLQKNLGPEFIATRQGGGGTIVITLFKRYTHIPTTTTILLLLHSLTTTTTTL